MAYDEDLADRIRDALAPGERVEERKMFGGLCFMLGGHMVVGVVGNELMARVGADGEDDALAQPHARPMDFTGRPMTGFVFVAAEGVATDEAAQAWVERARRSSPPFRQRQSSQIADDFVRGTLARGAAVSVVSCLRRARSGSRSKLHQAAVRGATPSGGAQRKVTR